MKKMSKILLETITVFVVSIVLLILFERYLLFYISWHFSLDYGELLDKITFVIFIGGLALFSCLLFMRFLRKKTVNHRLFMIIILSITSPLSRFWMKNHLNLPHFSYFQGDYLKCEKDSTIGILDKWGSTVVPCEFQFIYRFFDNEIGSERFASYNKEKDSKSCYLYIYESGKQIGVENLQFSLDSNVELFIQDKYGTLLEKWGGDTIHSTQFAYLNELRESREKAQIEILKAEEELCILSELAGYVKMASCPSQYYEDNSYENIRTRERFEESKRNFGTYTENLEDFHLKYARQNFTEGEYDRSIKSSKGFHTSYNNYLDVARSVLGSSYYDIMSSISSRQRSNKSVAESGTRRVSQEAIDQAVDENNSHRSSEKIIVEHQRQPVPVQEWVRCGSCQGTSKCPQCNGTGQNIYNSSNPYEPCLTCGRTGRCVMCGGQGGHYETYYR